MAAPRPVDYLVFAGGDVPSGPAGEPPAGYRFETWTPSLTRVRPRGVPFVPYAFWWAFHQLHLFRNRDYAMVLGWHGDALVHYLGLVPGYFRFPFVRPDDLQIAVVSTDPAHRGRRLAPFAINEAMRFRRAAGRRFWYMVAEGNAASIRAVERAGMTLVGRATRTKRLGIRLLGSYELRGRGRD